MSLITLLIITYILKFIQARLLQNNTWVFNSNIWRNLPPLQDINLQNLSYLDFDLAASLKVESVGTIRLPIYNFPLHVVC